MWLEFNGMPLKWHYPIGVLLDIYFNDIQLPWNIVVHFDKFPENVLMHCQNKYVITQIARLQQQLNKTCWYNLITDWQKKLKICTVTKYFQDCC